MPKQLVSPRSSWVDHFSPVPLGKHSVTEYAVGDTTDAAPTIATSEPEPRPATPEPERPTRSAWQSLRAQIGWFLGICGLVAAVGVLAFVTLRAARTTWSELELPESKRVTPIGLSENPKGFDAIFSLVAGAGADDWTRAARVAEPFGSVAGVLGFRGNPTRTFYGTGPVPTDPELAWTYPDQNMCARSSVGSSTRTWCGTGWTGQPAVFEREERTWTVFGAFDRSVHFVDTATGDAILEPFQTGDLVKGSVTVDPDGFPLVYFGSRDGYFRVVAFDGEETRELWKLSASDVSPTMWNDDWDSNALVIDDHLIAAGENGQLHIVRLGRSTGPDGRVEVSPELVFNTPGWDEDLLSDAGDREVSIESSPTLVGKTLYFTNSAGLVQGWDLTGLSEGTDPVRTFRFWSGDDSDATIVADETGALYVASEWQRANDRADEIGQIFKLDPSRADPLVWKIDTPKVRTQTGNGGVWATPALSGGLLYVPTHTGELLGINRDTGATIWEKDLPGPLWSSPVIIDNELVQADCSGHVRAFDISNPDAEPPELWSIDIGGCIESTPSVWNGVIYVGTRSGRMHAIRQAS